MPYGKLSSGSRALVQEFLFERQRLNAEIDQFDELAHRAARAVRAAGLTLREAGPLFGMSHGGVDVMSKGARSPRPWHGKSEPIDLPPEPPEPFPKGCIAVSAENAGASQERASLVRSEGSTASQQKVENDAARRAAIASRDRSLEAKEKKKRSATTTLQTAGQPALTKAELASIAKARAERGPLDIERLVGESLMKEREARECVVVQKVGAGPNATVMLSASHLSEAQAASLLVQLSTCLPSYPQLAGLVGEPARRVAQIEYNEHLTGQGTEFRGHLAKERKVVEARCAAALKKYLFPSKSKLSAQQAHLLEVQLRSAAEGCRPVPYPEPAGLGDYRNGLEDMSRKNVVDLHAWLALTPDERSTAAKETEEIAAAGVMPGWEGPENHRLALACFHHGCGINGVCKVSEVQKEYELSRAEEMVRNGEFSDHLKLVNSKDLRDILARAMGGARGNFGRITQELDEGTLPLNRGQMAQFCLEVFGAGRLSEGAAKKKVGAARREREALLYGGTKTDPGASAKLHGTSFECFSDRTRTDPQSSSESSVSGSIRSMAQRP